jgi:hypothetical protein
VFRNEIASFIFAAHLIAPEKDAKKPIVLLFEKKSDSLTERHQTTNNFVHLKVTSNSDENFRLAADVLFLGFKKDFI